MRPFDLSLTLSGGATQAVRFEAEIIRYAGQPSDLTGGTGVVAPRYGTPRVGAQVQTQALGPIWDAVGTSGGGRAGASPDVAAKVLICAGLAYHAFGQPRSGIERCQAIADRVHASLAAGDLDGARRRLRSRGAHFLGLSVAAYARHVKAHADRAAADAWFEGLSREGLAALANRFRLPRLAAADLLTAVMAAKAAIAPSIDWVALASPHRAPDPPGVQAARDALDAILGRLQFGRGGNRMGLTTPSFPMGLTAISFDAPFVDWSGTGIPKDKSVREKLRQDGKRRCRRTGSTRAHRVRAVPGRP